jgi:hypothetical protein
MISQENRPGTVTTLDCGHGDLNLREPDATPEKISKFLEIKDQHKQEHPYHQVSMMHNVNPQQG